MSIASTALEVADRLARAYMLSGAFLNLAMRVKIHEDPYEFAEWDQTFLSLSTSEL